MNLEFDGDIRGQIGFLVKRIQQALRAKMDSSLADNGLTTSQYAALVHLRESPNLSNAELARRSFVAPPTMIRIVQDLEKLGHITRACNDENAKVINISLTEKGKRTLKGCDSKVVSIQRQMLSGMSDEEITDFARFLVHSAEQLESSE
ncbi:MarR family winged helix-turn-helix transcriptional regulator [Hydrogenovibrio marinus]|uniref:HTH marR-type domain-containing protein n=1 Tax=Hydrogenovibrio marinus TaxID=28885 RepID=A0A066ZXE6_HYDMR|nr:MarR family transcriptional regulator [Hydrogenovibrio marinus]KDN95031.1 hypothetical protein EI16_01590 [Hydrogenovibrio marinus]BBN59497.1 putative transcriptional regulator, MarR family protein [Hydrogenovibrio marinus]